MAFHHTLSEETVFQRYLGHLGLSERTAHERLIRICFSDYDREMALVAEHDDPATGRPTIVGIGRLSRDLRDGRRRVRGPRHGLHGRARGLGTELLRRLVEIARAEGVAVIGAQMRAENVAMRKASERLGFTITRRAVGRGGPGGDAALGASLPGGARSHRRAAPR